MNRVYDWETHFYNTISNWRDTKFEWGKSDCCIFVNDCLNAIYGINWRIDFGRYATRKGALWQLKKKNIDGWAGLAEYYGGKPIDVNFVQRGNVVMYDNCMGINDGENNFFLLEDSVGLKPLPVIEKAWSFD